MAMKDPKPNYNALTRSQPEILVDQYEAQAEKAKTEKINMRITPRMLREVKAAAETNGYPKYQQWVTKVLIEAVAKTFPDRYADLGDEF